MVRGAKTSLTADSLEYLAGLVRQDEVLARVERETAEMPRAKMQISPDQGALMEVLVKATDARNALEVGTFTGYSAICIARALGPDGRLTCLELEDEYADIAQRNLEAAGLADRVEIRRGPAGESLDAMPEEPTYDFVFLDADKDGYPAYYDALVPRLRDPGGLLLLDNMLRGGRVLDPQEPTVQVTADLNERIATDDRVDSVLVGVRDGLTIVTPA